MTDVRWVHSHGADNKNPKNDLGGQPSEFEIAVLPMNNLFDNVSPEQAEVGRVDYRCFYVINKQSDEVIKDVVLEITSNDLCSTITFGSKTQNEEQRITIVGEPEVNGFMIISTEFGGPFLTCVYSGSWADFATEIEEKLRLCPFCTLVTVTLEASSADYAQYKITFLGNVKNRKVQLVKLLQNNLVSVQGSEYRISDVDATFNSFGSTQIKVTRTIADDLPLPGYLYVFNVTDGLFYRYDYSSYAGQVFALTSALEFNLIAGDELWVTMPSDQRKSIVNITKVQEGWPINQFSDIINNATSTPDFTEDSPLDVGILRPREGFFVWVKRTTDAGTSGCKGTFDFVLTGETESYP